ncbi:MAG: hypothetical protein OXC26_25345 [Albidovulum sp.]|nr:hypothetical protein [Albidovulum sp.]
MWADRTCWNDENEAFNALRIIDNLEYSYGRGRKWLGSWMPAFQVKH